MQQPNKIIASRQEAEKFFNSNKELNTLQYEWIEQHGIVVFKGHSMPRIQKNGMPNHLTTMILMDEDLKNSPPDIISETINLIHDEYLQMQRDASYEPTPELSAKCLSMNIWGKYSGKLNVGDHVSYIMKKNYTTYNGEFQSGTNEACITVHNNILPIAQN